MRSDGATTRRVGGHGHGFSLVEVLLSLVICSMLLGSIAAAFSSSCAAITTNDEFFRASQAARVALNQILADIRQCDAVQFINSKEIATLTMQPDLVTVKKDNDYIFGIPAGAKTGVLKVINKAVPTHPQYTLAANVSSLAFAVDTFKDKNGISHTSRVTVTISVDQGDNRVQLTGSAALRRLQSYN